MKGLSYLLILLISLSLSGCLKSRMALPKPPKPPPPPVKPEVDYTDVREYSYRTRSAVPVKQKRYEGSLWQDESSWGNLLRDHRARFRHDVVTITDLSEIIVIPKKDPAVAAGPGAGGAVENAAGQLNAGLDAINATLGLDNAEEEQNEVLANLKTISARVLSVLPNGNMVIIGEKVDYRRGNSVRYVTKIKGIVRPEDVNEKNEIASLKMARSEVKIRRQVMAKKLNLGALAPITGRNSAGLLDRLSHMATPASGGSAPVPTK